MIRCEECKGNNVQVKAWINPNTNKITDTNVGDECMNTDTWCDDCNKGNIQLYDDTPTNQI